MSIITEGTLPDACLSSNILRLNAGNTWTQAQAAPELILEFLTPI
jgi:hypothetical protein